MCYISCSYLDVYRFLFCLNVERIEYCRMKRGMCSVGLTAQHVHVMQQQNIVNVVTSQVNKTYHYVVKLLRVKAVVYEGIYLGLYGLMAQTDNLEGSLMLDIVNITLYLCL